MQNMPMMGQGSAQAQQGQDQGGGVIQNVDEMLGAIGDAIGSKPGAEPLAQRLMKIREEYRRVIEEAMKMGGGAGSSAMKMQASAGQPAERSIVPDRSQGIPQSPAGAY